MAYKNESEFNRDFEMYLISFIDRVSKPNEGKFDTSFIEYNFIRNGKKWTCKLFKNN